MSIDVFFFDHKNSEISLNYFRKSQDGLDWILISQINNNISSIFSK